MDCIECKAANPDDNRYCGECGAELGRTLDETVRKRNFRDRQATEIEITEAVAERLSKWAKWLAVATGVPIALFAVLLGWTFRDFSGALNAAKAEVSKTAKETKDDIGRTKQDVAVLDEQVKQSKSDVQKYQRVNQEIDKLQKKLLDVQGQVIDLGNKTLAAKNLKVSGIIEQTSKGPPAWSSVAVGCPAPGSLDPKLKWTLCFEGDPPHPVIVTHSGEHKGVRAVSGFSTAGFQDNSAGPKPTCSLETRGTFYVEKSAGSIADRPLLCAKKADGVYQWIALANVP